MIITKKIVFLFFLEEGSIQWQIIAEPQSRNLLIYVVDIEHGNQYQRKQTTI